MVVSRMDRVRNDEVRRRARIKREKSKSRSESIEMVERVRVEQRVLRWFTNVVRMNEYIMATRVLDRG